MIDDKTLNNCFSSLGTEYVIHNIKKISLNGISNSFQKSEWILEDLSSGEGKCFDLICTQTCSPQRLYYFFVMKKYESENDKSIFYILGYQPSDLKEYKIKFAFEEFPDDDIKRRIYIYEDLRTINDPSYNLIPDFEIMMSKMELQMGILTSEGKDLHQLLERCYLRIKSVYDEHKIIIG